MAPVANYEQARAALSALLRDDCVGRIVLLRGASGFGKTAVLRAFQSGLLATSPRIVAASLRSVSHVGEFFSQAHDALGAPSLTNFAARVAELGSPLKAVVSRNVLIGWNHQINVIAERNEERELTALTDAWFADLEALGACLFIFDDFHMVRSEVCAWLTGPFLGRVAKRPTMRVVIAGQTVPDHNNIAWGGACDRVHDLNGVEVAEHWMYVVRTLGRRIDAPDPHSALVGICKFAKGRPDVIMQFIEGLPPETSP